MRFSLALDVAQISRAGDADSILRATIEAAIWTAVETPGATTTGSLDISSGTEENNIKIIAELREQGYTVVSASNNHITISWQLS